MRQSKAVAPTVTVGDVVRLGEGAFMDAIVSRVYEHAACGWRFDCVRPYALESTVLTGTVQKVGERSAVNGVPSFGFETVDFMDASATWDVVRRAWRDPEWRDIAS